ncbi:hypothetical protein ACHAWO_012803 [Cyclotella atomus]|uniref:Uncharacterized protein n=1 Tax=Cyclotella atomus TaxID=382360 RepID=A0ABD3NLJ2_9STRA
MRSDMCTTNLQSILLSLLLAIPLITAQQHYLLLEITFDSNPGQISWKFSNSRSTTTLDSRAFDYYGSEFAGTTVKERLEILGEDDLNDDPLDEDVIREYSFVIYDQGGDGLCCASGEGSYAVYNKGELLLIGNAFGTSEENPISIDPKDFIETDTGSSSVAVSGGNKTEASGSGSEPIASFNTPTTPPPTTEETAAPIPTQPTSSPVPTAKPVSPSAEFAVNQERWYCGSSWDWIIRNCAEAIPCPGGDASVCPENFACFASTPCTPEPTDAPSDSPSMMPSVEPTVSPTKSPWSETAFITFLYGDSTASEGSDSDSDSSSNGEETNNGMLASEVNNALTNYDELQYHFYCGYSWSHADETCNKFCPTGDRAECPDNMDCFANTQCDGRDTPPPTESPAPSSSAPIGSVSINIGSGGSGGVSSGGSDSHSGLNYDLCTLCPDNQLDVSKSITINDKDVTCGSVENMFTYENLLMGSDNCIAVQKMYQDTCCYDACQLCELSTGEFLDVQDVLLEKGGYSATCQEVNNILSATHKEDKMCSDAKEQLAGDCCYKQCALCDADAGETTSWYATITFEDIQSTCLGLDFMLRTEQVGFGSDRCSDTRTMYSEQCCYVAPQSPCQLCEADGEVYGVNAAKSVSTVERQSTTSCAWINDDLAKISSNDQQCKDGKGAYFGQCCDLTGVLGTLDEEGAGEEANSSNGDTSTVTDGAVATGANGGQNVTIVEGTGNQATTANNSTTVKPEDNFWGSDESEWDPAEWNPPTGGTKGMISGMMWTFSVLGVYLFCL